ncbi:class III poly(R)-hydroxyalkanoic acid synthase subunit PhaC [Haloplanus salinus]|uniref:Poly(3-hydroxyalkanoate) polymerase subunit PhaC n=1 Tax=Haloplanus salinus TaxID=1126245 RepID=A0A368N3S2_9EURY|nr:class III poly(R)-hydroxyalkanoic acid synthase subunit PhaC [Haloplanus salinus]RCU44254.1 class III poly(R)-hydroxyalkanoic acid synthase subunit PhaC [Haloplanus salinus]
MLTDRRPDLRLPFETLLSAHRTVLQTATEGLHKTTLVPDRLEDAASADVGQTPSEVVYTENKLELLRYESVTEHQHRVPILIVYALINRPYILDLQPDRSIVRRLLEAGHDVYLIDWHEPSELDTSLSLHDYVNRYVRNCVDEVCERSSQDAINVLGYCMGGTMSVVYAALYPEKVNALGLMATGLYFDDTGGILELWGDEEHYDPRSVTETFGNVPGEFLAAGFDQMDPVPNNVTKYVNLYDRLENEDFVKNFARMEQWLSDSVDVAGGVYAQFLEDIYQDNRLYENELTIDGEHVDVTNIDMPLLQILGDYDNLVPPEASKPFNDVVGTDDVSTIEYPSGHVGLAMSNGAHRDLWPEVAEWFLEHSERPTLADVIGDGIEETLGVDVETDVTVGDVDEVEVVLADDDGEIAREVITRDATAIETFLEHTLGVEIGLDTGPEGIAVEVETDEGVVTTVVKDIGEAIRTEVEEAAEEVAVAGSYDLENVNGIGATYAKRLRVAGIDSVSELAVADDARVAEAAAVTEELAGTWITRARELVGPTEK